MFKNARKEIPLCSYDQITETLIEKYDRRKLGHHNINPDKLQ